MIMAYRGFLANQNIDETNSLHDLEQNISPDCNEEVNYIDHSIYYNDQDYKECIARSKGALRILNLNCGDLNAKFDDYTTAQGFSPKITRPTRSVGNSHTLIDNVFTNNLCKQHTSGILTHQISDHFITFSIVDGNIKHKNDHIKYVEVQNISSASIANFKNAIAKSDLLSQLDLNHNADPNQNYNILSSSLENAKNKHIPKKL